MTCRKLEKGFFKTTNITSTSATPPVVVKSTMKGRGDPGYLLTASECFCLSY